MRKRIVVAIAAFLMGVLFIGCSDKRPAKNKESSPMKPADEIESIAEESASEVPYYNPEIDYLVLVDSSHPLPDGWEDKIEVESFLNAVGDEVKVEKTAYKAYLKLKDDLESEGIYVDLDSAYRSVAEQQAIVDDFTQKYGADYARTYAAVPGYSEHHTGLALDLFLIVDGKIIYENEDLVQYPEIWEKIHEKLPKYGFILRYPGGGGYAYEPWHIRYVGIEAAKTITENNLYFEDYIRSLQ